MESATEPSFSPKILYEKIATTAPSAALGTAPPQRVRSVDAYRGFVMVLMFGGILHICKVSQALPDSTFWRWMCFHFSHVEWIGCSLHDLIQPSFSFLVGVALPFSLASRAARGDTWKSGMLHAAWRSLVLIFLGIFLRSLNFNHTNFTFEDTLTQIGLGYFILYYLARKGTLTAATAIMPILLAYWALFAFWPLPPASFDSTTVGVPADWPHQLVGFEAHWNKNANPAAYFDVWFLNLFYRPEPFVFNKGGYVTLSFIPTLVTMLFGVLAGATLQQPGSPQGKFLKLLLPGLVYIGLGWLMAFTGTCPLVKRIWTPSWTLFSAGWCFVFMAVFYAIIDGASWKTWAFPLTVVGMNSIAAYCMEWLAVPVIGLALYRHLGTPFFQMFGPIYQQAFHGATTCLVIWLILWWMWRQKIFLRI